MFIKKFINMTHSEKYFTSFCLKDSYIEVTLGNGKKRLYEVNDENIKMVKDYIMYEEFQYRFYVNKFMTKAYKNRIIMLISLPFLLTSALVSIVWVNPYILLMGIISGFLGLFCISRARYMDRCTRKLERDENVVKALKVYNILKEEVDKLYEYKKLNK